MCVGLAVSHFLIVTSCKPNAQVLGFNTDLSCIVAALNLILGLDAFYVLSAKRKCNMVTTGMSTYLISKSLHVFRVCTDPRGRVVLKRGSAVAPLLRLRVRVPPGEWMSVSCECCVVR
jgi:hypothetical protein